MLWQAWLTIVFPRASLVMEAKGGRDSIYTFGNCVPYAHCMLRSHVPWLIFGSRSIEYTHRISLHVKFFAVLL
jgi:hypothetical protein